MDPAFPPALALAERIERCWTGRALDDFAEVAAEALATAELAAFETSAVEAWLAATPQLPRQLNPTVPLGDPAITLWHGEDFVVDTYVWRRFASGIHDHKFSGAFVVIRGLTADCRYSFEPSEAIDDRVVLGTLSRHAVVSLTPGTVTPITAGPSFIHHPGHLQLPTQTLCVRLIDDPREPRNYDYFMPGLALGLSKEDYADPKLAELAELGDQPQALRAQAEAVIEGATAVRAMLALMRYGVLSQDLDGCLELIARLPLDHPALRQRLAEVLEVSIASTPSDPTQLDMLLSEASERSDHSAVLSALELLLDL